MVKEGGNGINESDWQFIHLVEDEERLRTRRNARSDFFLDEFAIRNLLGSIRATINKAAGEVKG